MAYAVDFQYSKQPGGDVVVKELSILPLEHEADPIVLLFKPPFPWNRLTEKYKRENSLLQRKVHGLSWDCGTIEYKQIGRLIRDSLREATDIYVIGSEKKKYMERFKYNAIDIIELGYLQVDTTKVVNFCLNHNFSHKTCCAAQNVKLIKKFMIAQKQWEDISMEWEYN